MSKQNILVIGPGWIGDLIISIALINALKEREEKVNIDILVNSNLSNIAKMIPKVRNVISSETQHGSLSLSHRIKLGLRIKTENYSECYILPNSLKSALIPLFANIPKRIGYLGEFRYGLINRTMLPVDRSRGMVNKYLNLIDTTYNAKYRPQIVLNSSLSINNKFNLPKNYIVLCPDAEYGPSKRWPAEKWRDLARSLSKKSTVVIVGIDKTIRDKLEEIASKKIINLMSKTSIEEVVQVLNSSKTVVTNDSGLMHVAAALNKKVIALYGSSSPSYTPPLIDDSKRAIIYKNLDCSPCFKRICPLGHTKCLNNISVNDVEQSIKSLQN